MRQPTAAEQRESLLRAGYGIVNQTQSKSSAYRSRKQAIGRGGDAIVVREDDWYQTWTSYK